MNVLVVEDEAKVANFLKKGLQQSGYEIDLAADGEEAYEKVRSNNYDIILLDLGLPDSQGIDTFNIMNYNAPDVPIIILTGLEDEIIAVSAVRRGAEDYLVKRQVDSQSLARSIKNSLSAELN